MDQSKLANNVGRVDENRIGSDCLFFASIFLQSAWDSDNWLSFFFTRTFVLFLVWYYVQDTTVGLMPWGFPCTVLINNSTTNNAWGSSWIEKLYRVIPYTILCRLISIVLHDFQTRLGFPLTMTEAIFGTVYLNAETVKIKQVIVSSAYIISTWFGNFSITVRLRCGLWKQIKFRITSWPTPSIWLWLDAIR